MDALILTLAIGDVLFGLWGILLAVDLMTVEDGTPHKIHTRFAKYLMRDYAQIPNGRWVTIEFAKECGYEIEKVSGLNKAVLR